MTFKPTEFTYIGTDGDCPNKTTVFGIEFNMNIPVLVKDEESVRLLSGMKMFVNGKPVIDASPVVAEATDEDDAPIEFDVDTTDHKAMREALKAAGQPVPRANADVEAAWMAFMEEAA